MIWIARFPRRKTPGLVGPFPPVAVPPFARRGAARGKEGVDEIGALRTSSAQGIRIPPCIRRRAGSTRFPPPVGARSESVVPEQLEEERGNGTAGLHNGFRRTRLRRFPGLWIWGTVLWLASCGGPKPHEKEDAEVRAAFFAFQRAFVDGDFEAAFALSSDVLKSRWLRGLLAPVETRDGLKYRAQAKARLLALPEELRPALEEWVAAVHRTDPHVGTTAVLPAKILDSAWLKESLAAHFREIQPELAREFRAIEYRENYRDGNSATIFVKGSHGTPEIWEAKLDHGQWKITHYMGAAPQSR